MLSHCWASIADCGPLLDQGWLDVLRLLGGDHLASPAESAHNSISLVQQISQFVLIHIWSYEVITVIVLITADISFGSNEKTKLIVHYFLYTHVSK